MDRRSGCDARQEQGDENAGDETDDPVARAGRRAGGLSRIAQGRAARRRQRSVAANVMDDETRIPALGPSEFDRRTFLDALLAVGFVSTAAAIAYPVSRYLVPPVSGEPAAQSATAGRAAALRPNTAAIFKFGSKPGIVVRTADGEVRAFSAV